MVPRASVTNYGEKLGTVIAATKGPSFLPPLYPLQSMMEPLNVHFPGPANPFDAAKSAPSANVFVISSFMLTTYTGEMKRRLSPAD